MQITTEARLARPSTQVETTTFTIDAGAKAFQMMLSGIYSNKPLAVIREAVQNGYDSHLRSNVTRPVDVTLPTMSEPILRIRDYGEGMSPEFMQDGYCRVTHSTKAHDNTSVGGLGIGRMSALSVCESYSVITYYHGMRHDYVVYLDDNRIPVISAISHEKSDESSGVEITVPIPSTQTYQYAAAATQALYDFPPDTVHVDGHDTAHTKYAMRTDLFGIRDKEANSAEHPRIVMGPLAYKVDPELLAHTLPDNLVQLLKVRRFDIFADIGAVDVHPSRETIDYSPVNARRIKHLLEMVNQHRKHYIDEYLKDAGPAWLRYSAAATLRAANLMRPDEFSPYTDDIFQKFEKMYATVGEPKWARSGGDAGMIFYPFCGYQYTNYMDLFPKAHNKGTEVVFIIEDKRWANAKPRISAAKIFKAVNEQHQKAGKPFMLRYIRFETASSDDPTDCAAAFMRDFDRATFVETSKFVGNNLHLFQEDEDDSGPQKSFPNIYAADIRAQTGYSNRWPSDGSERTSSEYIDFLNDYVAANPQDPMLWVATYKTDQLVPIQHAYNALNLGQLALHISRIHEDYLHETPPCRLYTVPSSYTRLFNWFQTTGQSAYEYYHALMIRSMANQYFRQRMALASLITEQDVEYHDRSYKANNAAMPAVMTPKLALVLLYLRQHDLLSFLPDADRNLLDAVGDWFTALGTVQERERYFAEYIRQNTTLGPLIMKDMLAIHEHLQDIVSRLHSIPFIKSLFTATHARPWNEFIVGQSLIVPTDYIKQHIIQQAQQCKISISSPPTP